MPTDIKLFLVVCALAELLAVILAICIWKGPLRLALKIAYTLLVFLPVAGPLFYVWIAQWPEAQHPKLQNNLPRGHYFHYQLSKRRDLDKRNKV